ncbi:MAG: biotin transporter BioY, partial [Elusimicrobiota bacterium]|nr:biotin transporter BioY [Elusimicrobiota bacterium]
MINLSVFTALFAALIAISGFIAIPAGALGVPIVLQNMLIVLSGLVLGGARGASAVGLFIILGALGMPIFAGGRGGLAVILGPTGGFIAGYFFAALIAGLIAGKPKINDGSKIFQYIKISIAALFAFIIIYLFGISRIMQIIMQKQSIGISASFFAALPSALIPFIPADIIKLIVIIPLSAKLRPIAARYI